MKKNATPSTKTPSRNTSHRFTRSVQRSNGIDIEHHQVVYRGPERRSHNDRRSGIKSELEKIYAERNARKGAKKTLTEEDAEKILFRLLQQGRRANEGYRELRQDDIRKIFPVEVYRGILFVKRSIEKTIKSIQDNRLTRMQAISKFVEIYQQNIVNDSNDIFLGVKVLDSSPESKRELLVIYNPITQKVFWMSTRRKIVDRRGVKSEYAIRKDEPPAVSPHNN